MEIWKNGEYKFVYNTGDSLLISIKFNINKDGKITHEEPEIE